jgi:hypothetical protein
VPVCDLRFSFRLSSTRLRHSSIGEKEARVQILRSIQKVRYRALFEYSSGTLFENQRAKPKPGRPVRYRHHSEPFSEHGELVFDVHFDGPKMDKKGLAWQKMA